MFSYRNLFLYHASELTTNKKNEPFPSLACFNFLEKCVPVHCDQVSFNKFITAFTNCCKQRANYAKMKIAHAGLLH